MLSELAHAAAIRKIGLSHLREKGDVGVFQWGAFRSPKLSSVEPGSTVSESQYRGTHFIAGSGSDQINTRRPDQVTLCRYQNGK